MRKYSKFALILVILVINSFIVLGVVPVAQTFIGNEGLTLVYPKYEYTSKDTNFQVHTHVYNLSNGVLLTNSTVSCNIHVYGKNGSDFLAERMDFEINGIDFAYTIPANYFNEIGKYSYIIQCNTSKLGGFTSGVFYVTNNGYENINYNYYFLIFTLICLLAFFMINGLYLDNDLKFIFILLSFLTIPFILNVLGNILDSTFFVNLIRLVWFAYKLSILMFFTVLFYILYKLTMELKIRKNPPPKIDSPLKLVKHKRQIKYGNKY